MKNKITYTVLGIAILVITSSIMAQVFLGQYKPELDIPVNKTIYNDNKFFYIVTEGYLYQFPGASDNYHGNYRMAIIRDKESNSDYIAVFNDRSISLLPRNKSNDK